MVLILCTDCGTNAADHEIHKLALNAVNDFFRENFTVPRYLVEKDLRAKDFEHHGNLAGAHNIATEKFTKNVDDAKSTSFPSSPDTKKGLLNTLVCSLRFYSISDHKNPMLTIPITMGKAFAYLGEEIGEKTQAEYEASKVEDFNRRIADLIKANKKLVKAGSLLEKNPDQGPYQLIKEFVSQKVPYHHYKGNQNELNRILNRSIFRARKHSEEALAEYMETDGFMNQLAQTLRSTDGIEDLDKIAIDIHSTKEICQPCQATLRWIKSHLEEFVIKTIVDKEVNKTKIINLDLTESALKELPQETLSEKIARFNRDSVKSYLTVSSQDGTKRTNSESDKESIKSDQKPSALQLRANPKMAEHKADEQERNKYTAFINDIYKTLKNTADSINSEDSRKKIAELERKLAEANKAREEAEARKGSDSTNSAEDKKMIAKLEEKLKETNQEKEKEAKARQEAEAREKEAEAREKEAEAREKEAEAKAKQKEEEAKKEAEARIKAEKELEYYKKIAESRRQDRHIKEEPGRKKQKTEERQEKPKPSPNPSQPHSKKIDREEKKR